MRKSSASRSARGGCHQAHSSLGRPCSRCLCMALCVPTAGMVVPMCMTMCMNMCSSLACTASLPASFPCLPQRHVNRVLTLVSPIRVMITLAGALTKLSFLVKHAALCAVPEMVMGFHMKRHEHHATIQGQALHILLKFTHSWISFVPNARCQLCLWST